MQYFLYAYAFKKASFVTLLFYYKVVFLDFCSEYKHNNGWLFHILRKWQRNLVKWNVKLYIVRNNKSFNNTFHFTSFENAIKWSEHHTAHWKHDISKEIVSSKITNLEIYRIQNKMDLKEYHARFCPTIGMVFLVFVWSECFGVLNKL